MSQRTKLATVFSTAGAVVIAGLVALFLVGNLVIRDSRRLGRYHAVVGELRELLSTLQDAETGQRGYLLTGQSRYLQPYDHALVHIRHELHVLERRVRAGELSSKDVTVLSQLTNRKLAELQQTISLRRTQGPAEALAVVETGVGKELMDSIRTRTEQMVAAQETALSSTQRRTAGLVWDRDAVAGLSTLLILVVFAWAYRRIMQVSMALRERNLVARVYFDSTAQGILVVNARGTVLRTNAAVEAMFGYGHHELRGKPIEMLVPERARVRHTANRRRYLQEPQSRQMGIGLDLAGRRKDGSEFPLEVSLSYIPSDHGHAMVICFISDVSERLALEHQTRQAETLNALGTIAAGIAHDLNNPLAIISSRAELMLSSLLDTAKPRLREDLEVLHQHAQRASRIASGLLSLASQRTGTRQSVNVKDLVEATTSLLGVDFRKSNIEVVTALDGSLPAIMADPIALQRVLMNLVLNARDAMPGGGKITIASSLAPVNSEMVQLSVADTGTGIPADVLSKLFDVFFTTKTNGTGLGLWMARRTLREHGGDIKVDSGADKGTKFTLTLPIMRDRPEETPAPIPGFGDQG
jgi:PAS domain S-box-containing protein